MHQMQSVLLVEGNPRGQKPQQVAAFDLDGTLIKPTGKGKFIEGVDDWTWLYESVRGVLQDFARNGFLIAIFSNQNGVEKNKLSIEVLQARLQNVVGLINDWGCSAIAFAAMYDDENRKPSPRMWDMMCGHYGVSSKIAAKSFFCGDAAGRLATRSSKKDFSCSDRMFAYNAGLAFVTPEELFLDTPVSANFTWYDPEALFSENTKGSYASIGPRNQQEVVVLVGPPASGKSSLAAKFVEAGYVHVSRDLQGSSSKCQTLLQTALSQGRSVIIDNTNPKVSDRTVALVGGIIVRCAWLNISKQLAFHLNSARVLDQRQGASKKVPDVAMHTYFKHLEPPTIAEGFAEVTEWWSLLGDKSRKELFYRY